MKSRAGKDPDKAQIEGMSTAPLYATWPASINGSDVMGCHPEFPRHPNSFRRRIISKWDYKLKADGKDLRLVNIARESRPADLFPGP